MAPRLILQIMHEDSKDISVILENAILVRTGFVTKTRLGDIRNLACLNDLIEQSLAKAE